ncbi:M48 family metalloprotease [Nonomuraea sp. NPDC050547]|uniref:M48 family metalloprotease n=1 Tax=Nonomuraea sp. NPDC050547 TaxID=3364368 RepID=UPI0037A6CC0D
MTSWRDRPRTPTAEGLHDEAGDDSATGGRLARLASYAAALLVHLLTLALVAAGIWLITRPGFIGIILGAGALGLAWLMAPRPGKLPDGVALGRTDAPELFRLVDEIAAALGAPRPHMIVVTGEVNAAYGTYGLLRRRFLELGYPFWLALTPQERIAMLGHELAHSVNQDTRHGFVVGSALGALAELRETARLDGDTITFGKIVVAPLRLVAGWSHTALERITHRATQRAEYRADLISLRVAGSQAALTSIDKGLWALPHLADYLGTQAHQVRGDLWAAVRSYVAEVPEDERDRRRRTARQQEARVDTTHPPTHLRRDLLACRPYTEPIVRAPRMEPIDRELDEAARRIASEIVDNARAALYM